MLALGVSLVILAITTFVYWLYAPPVPLVPASRRVAPGTEVKRPLERVVDGMDGIVDYVLRRRGWNPFPAYTLELAGIRTPQATIVTTIIVGTLTASMVGYMVGGAGTGVMAGLRVPGG